MSFCFVKRQTHIIDEFSVNCWGVFKAQIKVFGGDLSAAYLCEVTVRSLRGASAFSV